MIVEYIRYELNQHSTEELLDAYRAAALHLRAAPECLGYELAVRDDAPSTCVVRITWQSAEAHMSAFRRGPHFPPFLDLIRPYIGEIAEMKHYTLTDVVWARD
ncbi:MAG TPA: antibiotic biosynthesis monooxygenase [Pseudoduganella sp.]